MNYLYIFEIFRWSHTDWNLTTKYHVYNNIDISYLQMTITSTLINVKELISLTAVQLYTPAWLLSMFCKFRIDVVPAGRLGPVQFVVQLGIQSAVQFILLTLSVSLTVYVVFFSSFLYWGYQPPSSQCLNGSMVY
jgi:hypothetical protein